MRNGITPIGITNYRQTNQVFGIKDNDRLGHIYCIGKTGVGKSTLIKNMAQADVENGNGICIIDPHGDLATDILKTIPEWRKADVIYFNPKDTHHPIPFNPLKGVHPKYHHLVASSLISTFKKIWSESWGPRMEYILRYTLLTLLHVPDTTLLDIQPLLTNADYRSRILLYVPEDHIHTYWNTEFDKMPKVLRAEAISPILNKIGLFQASAPLRATIGQKTRGIRIQEVLDKKKILICNLSKGELGEDASALLGSIILTTIQHAALYRARLAPEQRIPFYTYIDEMQSFVTLSFINILSEARKYGLSLFLANQYIEQLDERIKAAIFGNIGTLIAFRVGARDAEYLKQEFAPIFGPDDLINLAKYCMYLKLMIDGATSQPFSATSLPPQG